MLLYICLYMSIFCYYNKIPKGLDTHFKNRLIWALDLESEGRGHALASKERPHSVSQLAREGKELQVKGQASTVPAFQQHFPGNWCAG